MKAKPHMMTAREKRHNRVRARVAGTGERPRLNVFRSLNHIYAQVIDDVAGRTLVAASTLESDIKGQMSEKTKIDEAGLAGTVVAQRAKEQGIETVVFDRGGYLYHGRIKALADAARAAGLRF